MKPPYIPVQTLPAINAIELQARIHLCLQSPAGLPTPARLLLEEANLALNWLDVYQRLYGDDPDTLAYAQFIIHEEHTPA